ncbi:unnamed protein product [Heligmosomoides polygyrus]|uniref:Peptidase A1 domain-containing protein n=1 Tax=Heligmosomoides polygyrus TaxID=6339 RepID=A0A183GHS6_HELPZ|nr:unnamed protein product [Heligmosomoides polygyrus]
MNIIEPGSYRYVSVPKMSFAPKPVVDRLLSTFRPDFTFWTRRGIAVTDAIKGLLLDAIYVDIDCQEEEEVQVRGSIMEMGPFYTYHPVGFIGASDEEVNVDSMYTYAFNEEEVVIPCQEEDCSSLVL